MLVTVYTCQSHRMTLILFVFVCFSNDVCWHPYKVLYFFWES